jgi:integrase
MPRPQRRPRGTGSLLRRGRIWWMKIPVGGGKPIRESTGMESKAKANVMLLSRLKEVASGQQYRPGMEKITVAELAQDFLQEYRINGRKSLADAESRWRLHLEPWFGSIRASRVTSDLVNRYIEHRQTEAKNATINRELAALRRMFSIALQATPPKASRAPRIRRLPENNVRKGFLTDDPYDVLAEKCRKVGLWLEAMLEVGYTFGWRASEVRKLRVWQVELGNRRIILEVGSTKNKEGRTVKFATGSNLERLLTECCRGKRPNDFLFTREDGEPIKDFRGLWWKVCYEAGLTCRICKECGADVDEKLFCPACKEKRNTKQVKSVGLLFHDLRRTAARNARAAGVHEEVIMQMGGWKTRSVFSRYAIIAESDLDDAARLIEARRAKVATPSGN